MRLTSHGSPAVHRIRVIALVVAVLVIGTSAHLYAQQTLDEPLAIPGRREPPERGSHSRTVSSALAGPT